jgi:hypothetical protein
MEGDHGARAAFGIVHLLDIELEVDRADDAVAELFVNQYLERRAVDLHHFIEPVDGGMGRPTTGMLPRSRMVCSTRVASSPSSSRSEMSFAASVGSGCRPSSAATTKAGSGRCLR